MRSMRQIGPVEKTVYRLREEHPLVIPQIDPDKHTEKSMKAWFSHVDDAGISFIAVGGSTSSPIRTQKAIDIALSDFDLKIALYLTPNLGAIVGRAGRTAVYWTQVPGSSNTFYGWDGLVSNAMQIEENNLEPIPAVYVFDDRDFAGTANWMTRVYPIPREKPEISLAMAKAAQYFGIRLYIMAGGSGSSKHPPAEHVKKLSGNTDLFIIPTSGITTAEHAREMFEAGADAIHVGNRLEAGDGFGILDEMVKASERFQGKRFM